jgi:hypothetical protein
MENLEKPKPLHEIQPQKVEETPVTVKQNALQQESVADQEKQRAIQAETDIKALQKVREELGISKPKESVDDDNEDLDDEFHAVSGHLNEFESNLRKNKFNRIKLNADTLKVVNTDNKFDPRKTSEVIQSITRTFKKGFLPEDPEERMSIESHNFTNVIDSIDDLSARFTNLRKTVEGYKRTPENEASYKILEKTISDFITAMRIKKEELEDANSALRRYRGR